MKEAYLHLIWKQKRISFHKLTLTSGQKLEVKSTGIHNQESGPDFFNGEIILDHVIWRGNIEMHVKSSDWYVHKHHLDPAYNNVILHVVYQHDREVIIEGRKLPTIELKEFIDLDHYKKYLSLVSDTSVFSCRHLINQIDSVYLESMKEKAILSRVQRKMDGVVRASEFEFDFSEILYQLLGQAFGMKVNSQPFRQLTHHLPLKIIKRERKEHVRILILRTSGVLSSEHELFNEWNFYKKKYDLIPLPIHLWKKKGLRSFGFPEIRLHQFAALVQNFDFDTTFTHYKPKEIIEYLNRMMDFEFEEKNKEIALSQATKDSIIINCFIPFLCWYGHFKRNELLVEKAIEILSLIKSEHNAIISQWEKLGVKSKNAYDSQALLEIYNEFCVAKKCLNCTIGNKILRG